MALCSGRVSLANEGGPSLPLLAQAGTQRGWMPGNPARAQEAGTPLCLPFCFLPLSSLLLYPWFKGGSFGPRAFWTPPPAVPPFHQPGAHFSPSSVPFPLACFPSPQDQKHFTLSLPYTNPLCHNVNTNVPIHSSPTNIFCSCPVPEWSAASAIYCCETNNKSNHCFVVHHNCVD